MLESESAYQQYRAYIKKLGSYDNTFILAVNNQPSIFDSAFLKKLYVLQKAIDSSQAVTSTISLLDLKKYTRLLTGDYLKRFYIQYSHPERFRRDSLLIAEDSLLTQHFISRKNNWATIIFQLQDQLALPQVDSLVQKIDSTANSLNIGTIHLTGRKYMESEFLKIMTSEFKISLLLSLIFIILILWWLYRSIAGIVLPVLCVGISLLMLYGYLAIFNRPLTILSNLFPTIVLIIGISDVIHLSSKYSQESAKGLPPVRAMDITLKEIGLTTLINTLTTAIGFLTLLFMSMKAMRSFGIDAAIGLLIAWINAVVLLPALLVRFNFSKAFGKSRQSETLKNLLEWILERVNKNPVPVAWVFGFLTFISVIGIFHINTNNLMLTSLPAHNRLHQDFSFFDQNAGGRTLELIIETQGDYQVYDQPVIEQIARLESYLKKQMNLSQVISPVLPIKWLNRSASVQGEWQLPAGAVNYSMYKNQINSNLLSFPVQITDSTGTIGRLTGRIKDQGRLTIENKINRMQKWIDQNLDASVVGFSVTGSDYLTDLGHQRRIENTVTGFILEVVVIAIIIGMLYRSGRMVLITLVVNLIPIIMVAGFMGYTGIELRGSNTIVFAIGYVIAADNTLHFINRYRLELRKGYPIRTAIRNTLLFTGSPIIVTSIILLGGFSILLHSSFGDVFYHGLLVSIIIVAALFTDLLLTPVMLIWFYSKSKSQ